MRSITSDLLWQRWTTRQTTEPSSALNRAVYECVRHAILDGSLPAAARLPASRELASALGISRNSVTHAYEQLHAEGYVRTVTGSGTYVSNVPPEQMLWSKAAPRQTQSSSDGGVYPSARRGRALVRSATASTAQWGAFMPGVPEVRMLPWRKLERCAAQERRSAPPQWFSYAASAGHPLLRQELALYLRQVRSVSCEPEQILVMDGVHQAVDLISRLLGDPGDLAWMEEPGYWGFRGLLNMNGFRIKGIPVGPEGLELPRRSSGPSPRLIFVTPSHQYPLGSVMSLSRRLALVKYARQNRSWIVEDDYDSEFRFEGRPIPSLQGLDSDSPVIYIGTFSKTLYPGLRVAYVVLPRSLVDVFEKAHAELYRAGRLLTQAMLARFIAEGHYLAHVRRMRLVYAGRRAALRQLVRTRLGEQWLHAHDSNAGLHLVLSLPAHADDVRIAQCAGQHDVLVQPLSRYYGGHKKEKGLLLGFGCVDKKEMFAPFERLVACLDASYSRDPALPPIS
ncbi:MAG: PLP-dependent aminotransferase family protein [Dehalococcoidia bacterium]